MAALGVCRILFWNVGQKNLSQTVSELAQETQADIVILAESGCVAKTTLTHLKKKVDPSFYLPHYNTHKSRFDCFCRSPQMSLSEIHKGARISIRKLHFAQTETLLVIVHGVDVRNYDPAHRQERTHLIMNEIAFAKNNDNDNKNVILIGDINMNPFEQPMNLASGFNAMMTKSCIRGGYRTIEGVRYDFFYNPMWSLFGDGNEGPAGTIYNTSNQGMYGWSMFDQVILSSSTVDKFSRVEIITKTSTQSLLDNLDRPDSVNYSDHLPILVELTGNTK